MATQDSEVTRRASALSISIEGDALLDEAVEATASMALLLDDPSSAAEPSFESARSELVRLEERVHRRELHVALLGVDGSGKRTFVDALFGDRRLGQARGQAPAVTLLRNRATPRYQARFADGTTEDFAHLVPDRSREHDQRVREAEGSFIEAQRVHAELEARAKTAEEAALRAREELRRVVQTAESALEVEQATVAGFSSAQQAETHARQALSVAERPIPTKLRQPFARMGLFVRLWRVLFVLFRKELWRGLEAARAALLVAQERLVAMRERATAAADELQRTRELVRAPQAVSDARREASDEARRIASRASEAKDAARRAMDQRRQELARYVEDRLTRFFAGIRRACERQGNAAPLVEIWIEYPAELIPEDVVLVDLPGPELAKDRARVRTAVEELSDANVLLCDLEHAAGVSTIELLRELRQSMPRLTLVLSKADAIFLDAVRDGHPEPWERVDEARRSARRAHAGQLGSDESDVLCVAVAAKAALDDPDSGLAERFRAETARLFELLRQERAILIGSRTASLLSYCVTEARRRRRTAERAYRQHLAELQAERMPEPEAFHQSALRDAQPLIERASAAAIEDAAGLARDGYAKLKAALAALALAENATAKSLRERELALSAGANKLESKLRAALQAAFVTSVEALETRVVSELSRRYRLADVRSLRTERALLALDELGLAVLGAPRIPAIVASFRRARLLLTVLGVGLAAVGGWFAAPWLASMLPWTLPRALFAALAGALGSLLAFAKTWGDTRAAALLALESALVEEEAAAIARINARGPALAASIRDTLDASVEQVIILHGRDMIEPTHARERALDVERTQLGELHTLVRALEQHATRLTSLRDSALELSRLHLPAN